MLTKLLVSILYDVAAELKVSLCKKALYSHFGFKA